MVHGATGSSDLVEFVRFEAGEVLRKKRGGQGPKNLRLVGNSLFTKEIPDGSRAALVCARDLDAKIESLLTVTAE